MNDEKKFQVAIGPYETIKGVRVDITVKHPSGGWNGYINRPASKCWCYWDDEGRSHNAENNLIGCSDPERGLHDVETVKTESAVNHPSHYNQGKIEVIEFIEDQKLSYHLGNAIKYICRAKHKADGTKYGTDLEKAIWYLRREIELYGAEIENRIARRPNEMNK